MLKAIVPHLTFFGVLVVLLIVGVAGNVSPLAYFFGALAALVTDPLLLLGALAIGALSKNLKILLLVTVVFGVLLSIYIANVNKPLGAEFRLSTTVIRIVAIIALALVANALRVLSTDKSNSVPD